MIILYLILAILFIVITFVLICFALAFNNLKKVYKDFLTDVSNFDKYSKSVYDAVVKERKEVTTIYQKIVDNYA